MKKLRNKIKQLKATGSVDNNIFKDWDDKFKSYIEDDLNTANAMTLLYDLLKSDVDDSTKLALIQSWDKVFSLDLIQEDCDELNGEILKKIEERNLAKKNKDFAKADMIRDELLKQGIKLIDGREGTTFEYVNKM